MSNIDINALLLSVCSSTDPLDVILAGGHVARFHTAPGLRKQSVAEHSWRVAAIAHYLWPNHPQIIIAAIFHDAAEVVTGDFAAPIKRLPGMKETLAPLETAVEKHLNIPTLHNEYDYIRMKCADYLELVLTAAEQSATSAHARRIVATATEYIFALVRQLPEEERNTIVKLRHHFVGQPAHRIDPTGQDHPFGFDSSQDV